MPVEKEKVQRFKYWIIGMVNGIEARDLVQMIKNNDVPLPFELELPDYFSWVRDAVIENKELVLEQITYESAMKYSGEFRPDLKVILQHARGKEWLMRFIKVIRFMIENIELSPYEMKVKFFTRAKKIHQARKKVADAETAQIKAQEQEELQRESELVAHKETKRILEQEKTQLDALNKLAQEKQINPKILNSDVISDKRSERKSLYDNSPYDVY